MAPEDQRRTHDRTVSWLGRLKRAVVRPPLVKLGEAEISRLAAALTKAGFTLPERRRSAA